MARREERAYREYVSDAQRRHAMSSAASLGVPLRWRQPAVLCGVPGGRSDRRGRRPLANLVRLLPCRPHLAERRHGRPPETRPHCRIRDGIGRRQLRHHRQPLLPAGGTRAAIGAAWTLTSRGWSDQWIGRRTSAAAPRPGWEWSCSRTSAPPSSCSTAGRSARRTPTSASIYPLMRDSGQFTLRPESIDFPPSGGRAPRFERLRPLLRSFRVLAEHPAAVAAR